MGQLRGYACASTSDQTADLQTNELTAAGCARLYVDHISGSLDSRPQLDRLLEDLLPGDTLVIRQLDQLGRSLPHVIDTVTELKRGGVGFRALRDPKIDTTNVKGAMEWTLMAWTLGNMARAGEALERELSPRRNRRPSTLRR